MQPPRPESVQRLPEDREMRALKQLPKLPDAKLNKLEELLLRREPRSLLLSVSLQLRNVLRQQLPGRELWQQRPRRRLKQDVRN